jgi:hypothetical protein
MLRKLLSLGALFVVALALGASPASAKRDPGHPDWSPGLVSGLSTAGFSDGRLMGGFDQDGFSDGRLRR